MQNSEIYIFLSSHNASTNPLPSLIDKQPLKVDLFSSNLWIEYN